MQIKPPAGFAPIAFNRPPHQCLCRYAVRAATAGYPPLSLTAVDQRKLAALYRNDTVAEALAYDSVAALRRQLAHEARTEISLADYNHVHPYQHGSNQCIEQSAEVLTSAGCNGAARLKHVWTYLQSETGHRRESTSTSPTG